MSRISTNMELVDLIVARTMSVLDKKPVIVGDVYLKDEILKIYINNQKTTDFFKWDFFDFAVVPKKGDISHFISIGRDMNGLVISVKRFMNSEPPLFKVTIMPKDDKYDMVNALYDRIYDYYYNDIDKEAEEAINSVFGD